MLGSRVSTLLWSVVLQWSRVGINAVVFLLLSRWLTLAEIGAVAAVQAPILVAQALMSTMIPEFVVQERFVNQRRLSTIFWLSIILGLLLCCILLIAGPHIANGVNDPSALQYAYVLSICPLLWALSSTFDGFLRRQLNTKVLARRTLFASTTAATVAIAMGYYGLGAWSLIAFAVINAFVSSFLTIISCQWRPNITFKLDYLRVRFRKMMALGGRQILAAATFPAIQYAVTWQLGATSGGVFQIATRLYTLVDSLVMTPYRFVVMPIFAQIKKGVAGLDSKVVQAVSLGSVISCPAYILMLVSAPLFLPLLIGETNGSASVMSVQFLCVHGVLSSLSGVINQILVARGFSVAVLSRSFLMFWLAVVPAIIASMLSVEMVALTYGVVGGGFGFVLSLWFARRFIDVSVKNIFAAWIKPLLASSVIFILFFINHLFDDVGTAFLKLVVLFCVAPVFYLLSLFLFMNKELKFISSLIFKR